jgi:asparagine N-glycosylation enzyme membrane subunit Stt3
VEAALVLTVPVMLFLLTVWALHWRHKTPGPFRAVACPVTATVVLATSWSGEPVLLTGLAVAALVVVSLLVHRAPVVEPTPGVMYEAATVP